MDTWFESASKVFEVFLEAKLEQFGASTFAVTMAAMFQGASVGAAEAPQVDAHLRARPAAFADPAEEAVFAAMEGLPSGFGVETGAEAEDAVTLYGELTTAGLRQLADYVVKQPQQQQQMVGPAATSNRHLVFWDMGSGTGRVTFETLLLLRQRLGAEAIVVEALGVEFCRGRHDVAESALQRLIAQRHAVTATCDVSQRPPALFHGDFLNEGLPLVDDADAGRVFAFCCGVGFDDALCGRICDRLAALGDRLLGAVLLFKHPEILMAAHPLLDGNHGFEVRIGTIAASWMDAAPALFVNRSISAT
jgi:hypothetical protein